jgi:hypothetical protein
MLTPGAFEPNMSCLSDCWERYHTPLTIVDEIRLSPFQKWSKYRRPPFKFMLSLLLVACTTAIVVGMSQTLTPYLRAGASTWNNLLAPAAAPSEQNGAVTTYFLYDLDSLRSSLNVTASSYFLVNASINYFDYAFVSGASPAPIVMEVKRYARGKSIFDANSLYPGEQITDTYLLRGVGDIGPFSNSSLAADMTSLANSLASIRTSFQLRNNAFFGTASQCFLWTIVTQYSFTSRVRMDMTIQTSATPCSSGQSVLFPSGDLTGSLVIAAFVLILSIWLQILVIRAVWHSYRNYKTLKERNEAARKRSMELLFDEHAYIDFDQLSCSERMRFFNVWFFVNTIANVMNGVGAGLILADQFLNAMLFVAFGCMMMWISLVQFLEAFPALYSLISTLKFSAPRLLKFVAGVVPIFMGYTVFGVAYFSDTTQEFSSLDRAAVTLFSVLNGDQVLDTFQQIAPKSLFLSRLYLYTFVSLFIYAVLNMFIAIIEETFQHSQAFTAVIGRANELDTDAFDSSSALLEAMFEAPPVDTEAQDKVENQVPTDSSAATQMSDVTSASAPNYSAKMSIHSRATLQKKAALASIKGAIQDSQRIWHLESDKSIESVLSEFTDHIQRRDPTVRTFLFAFLSIFASVVLMFRSAPVAATATRALIGRVSMRFR